MAALVMQAPTLVMEVVPEVVSFGAGVSVAASYPVLLLGALVGGALLVRGAGGDFVPMPDSGSKRCTRIGTCFFAGIAVVFLCIGGSLRQSMKMHDTERTPLRKQFPEDLQEYIREDYDYGGKRYETREGHNYRQCVRKCLEERKKVKKTSERVSWTYGPAIA
ncbi:unnamed protein product [Effrenium voratum]|nr:unnamed protein product [Effrenium voratum]